MTGCQVQKSGLVARMWRGCAMKVFGCVNKTSQGSREKPEIGAHRNRNQRQRQCAARLRCVSASRSIDAHLPDICRCLDL
jgi:hypothetical protein